jgi:methylamine dehydrogenase heavy chain
MIARVQLLAALLVGFATFGQPVAADLPPEQVGQVMTLPEVVGDHWVWVPDQVFRHSALFDGDTGKMLGALDSGMQISPKAPMWSKARQEVYVVDTTYAKAHRGERKDYVAIYDAVTFNEKADVEIPARSTDTGTGIALVGMLDGDRFVLVLNQSPGASVSVVDVGERRVASEIQTQGCAGVFPAGPDRFGMLCGDGTAMSVHLAEDGTLDHIARSERFFDPVADPVTEKGARDGQTWRLVSFEGMLHEVDFSGDAPRVDTSWSLFTDGERADGWRVGGAQHVAYHPGARRFYSIVHEGGPGSHKDPGAEIWVYDVATKKRIDVFEAPNLIPAFIGPQAGFEADSTTAKIFGFFLPNPGVHSIAVTEDDAPLLFCRNKELGAVGVMDALTGEQLRDIGETGLAGTLLVVP